ncbi:MAG: hypothetical protein ACJAWL_000175 [Motiliproteus sp.]
MHVKCRRDPGIDPGISPHLYGHVFAKRRTLNEQLNQAEKGSKKRYQIGRTLEKVRNTLNSLPAVVSTYQITFKAKESLMTFLNWVCDETGAKMAAWLPVKVLGESWSDDPADKSRTLYGHKLSAYLENQRLRRCERWRGGDCWWAAVMDEARRFEVVPEYEDEGAGNGRTGVFASHRYWLKRLVKAEVSQKQA